MLSLTWNDLRINNQVCDGVVETSDGTMFPIHRVILSGFSPFFRAYFTNCLASDGPELTQIMVPDIPSSIVANIIEFAYTGNCPTTEDNVYALMVTADQLCCESVVRHCCAFITERLSAVNCIANWRFAKTYFCRELEEKAWKWMCEWPAEAWCSPDYLRLTAQEVRQLLSADELNVAQEESLYPAVARWVRADPPARCPHFADLLACIRFGLVSLEYYMEVIKTSEFHTRESEELLKTIDTLFETDDDSFNFRYCYFRPRLPNEVIFVIGGWSDGNPTDMVETYDKRSDMWYLTNVRDQRVRAYHGAVVIDNKIYVIGGFDGVEFFSTMYCFDPVTYKWTEKACTHDVRCYVSVCEYEGEIYAFGGFNGRARLNSAERYSPALNQWTVIASMAKARSDASAAAYNGRIYVAGGFDGEEVMRSVEVYNVDSNVWDFVDGMTSPRSGVSLITHDRYLYAIGGFDGIFRLKTVERYNPYYNRWDTMANMTVARSNLASVVVDGNILVIGGYNGQTTISDSEQYDVTNDCWTVMANMNLNRSALAACVVRGLPNIRSYTFIGEAGVGESAHGLPEHQTKHQWIHFR